MVDGNLLSCTTLFSKRLVHGAQMCYYFCALHIFSLDLVRLMYKILHVCSHPHSSVLEHHSLFYSC